MNFIFFPHFHAFGFISLSLSLSSWHQRDLHSTTWNMKLMGWLLYSSSSSSCSTDRRERWCNWIEREYIPMPAYSNLNTLTTEYRWQIICFYMGATCTHTIHCRKVTVHSTVYYIPSNTVEFDIYFSLRPNWRTFLCFIRTKLHRKNCTLHSNLTSRHFEFSFIYMSSS